MNATAEPGLEDIPGEEGPEIAGPDGDEDDDILYQKDASFSAHLDLGQEDVSPSPSDLLEESTTTLLQDNVHFLPAGATFSPPQQSCLLDCGVGVCSLVSGTEESQGIQRCQCPLGRTGKHCELGEYIYLIS